MDRSKLITNHQVNSFAFGFFVSVTQSIRTAWDVIVDLTVTSDDSVVVSGTKNGQKLLKYNLHQLQQAPSSIALPYGVGRMAEVNIDGKQCVAVCNP